MRGGKAVLAAIAIFLIFLALVVNRQVKIEKACIERGGVPVYVDYYDGRMLCLSRELAR